MLSPQEFADLTFVLTVKLVVLSLLTALQMAVSQRAAAGKLSEISGLLVRPSVFLLTLLGGLILALWMTGQSVGRSLAMVALAVPLILPLVLLRGLALGRLDMARTIASAQLEMIVRLGLSLLFWALGWGLVGLGLALALALLLAWVPLRGQSLGQAQGLWHPLILAASSFAALQLAHVLMLDGDILLGRWVLAGNSAGQLAALGLIQRVQFFACFGLATILIPMILQRRAAGLSLIKPISLIAMLFASTALPLLAWAWAKPTSLLTLMVGSAYAGAEPALGLAVASASLLTFTYLALTALLAIEVRTGLWIALAIAGLQIAGQGLFATDLISWLSWKLICQTALALGIAGLSWRVFTQHPL